MRIPRPRLTVRRMMVLVALAAPTIAYVVPALRAVVWLYQNPFSVGRFDSSILIRPDRFDPAPANPSLPTYLPNQAFVREVRTICVPSEDLPAGLPYWVSVQVDVTDPKTFTTVYETQRHSRRIITASAGRDGEIGTDLFRIRQRTPGSYAIRYTLHVTDLFGRSIENALGTEWFDVK